MVIDEFSELLSAKPEFIDLFVMIGRLGRSLGVHLLLASQRLEEGRLRGLDTQLSYRIGLRTFSAAESRIVLGVPDAYELPSAPGNGYLKVDVAEMTRFKAAYVSGPADPETASPAAPRRLAPVIVPYGPAYIRPREIPAPDGQPEPPAQAAGTGQTGQPNTASEAGPAGDAARPAGRPADRAGRGGPADLAAAAQPGPRAEHAAAAAVHHPGRLHHRGPALARPAAGGHRDRGPAVRAAA